MPASRTTNSSHFRAPATIRDADTERWHAAGRAVSHAGISDTRTRLVSLFLDNDGIEVDKHELSPLMARCVLPTLDGFISSLGGMKVHSLCVSNNEVRHAEYSSIMAGDDSLPYLHEGLCFYCLPDRRVIVEVSYFRSDYSVEVLSDRDAAGLYRQWLEYAREHNHLRGREFMADGELVQSTNAECTDLFLPDAILTEVRTQVVRFLAQHAELVRRGIKASRGIILSGPPGTGKTRLARTIAKSASTSVVWVTSQHVGDMGVDTIMEIARFCAPALVILEDIDLYAEERAIRRTNTLGELMNQMDGARDRSPLVFLATTNNLEVVEAALRNRPGRFDRVIDIGEMDAECRCRFISRLLQKHELTFDEHTINHAVRATDGLTGAQIEELLCTTTLNHGCLLEPNTLVTPEMIDGAMRELQYAKRRGMGFHVEPLNQVA